MTARRSNVKLVLLLCVIALSLMAIPAFSQSISKSNSTSLAIPDAGGWVSSDITITSAPANAVITGIDITFSCTHPRGADLDIDLNDESSSKNYDVWPNSPGVNPTKTITGISIFNGLSVNQTWHLYVQDTTAGKTGSITSWTITIYYQIPEGQPYIFDALIKNVTNTKDTDSDGYYEDFAFDVAVDADYPDAAGNVAAKIICTTTGQYWKTAPWAVSGEVMDYKLFHFAYSDFAPYLTGQTALNFDVELWDPTFTTKYSSMTELYGGPINAETAYKPYIREAQIADLTNTSDIDNDGYLDNFQFKIKVDADIQSGSTSVGAKITCNSTGQVWTKSAWTITGQQIDWGYITLSQSDFAGLLNGHTNLDFTVQLWDGAFTKLYDIRTFVVNEPVNVEPSTGCAISGRIVTSDGQSLSGVVLSGLPGNPVTGTDGTYTIAIPTGWSGVVTPTKTGCIFTPASRTYSGVSTNKTLQDYSATMNLAIAKREYLDAILLVADNLSVSQVLPTCVYIETDDRSAGIRVNTTEPFVAGDVVRASGLLSTDTSTGERYLTGSTGLLTKTSTQPREVKPMGMSLRSLGGSKSRLLVGIEGASGTNNVGLLVTVWGKVSHIGSGFFYLDDGSGVNDGSGWPGVKCSTAGHIVPTLTQDQFFYFTGISSCYKDISGKIRRIVL